MRLAVAQSHRWNFFFSIFCCYRCWWSSTFSCFILSSFTIFFLDVALEMRVWWPSPCYLTVTYLTVIDWRNWACSAWKREGFKGPMSSLPTPMRRLLGWKPCSSSKKGSKLQQSKVKQDKRKKISTINTVKQWNKLPQKVVKALSSSVFQDLAG